MASEGKGDAFVLSLGSLESGKAPAVHATTDTHGNRAKENLSVCKVVCSVQVKNNVIETCSLHLHLGSSVTNDKFSLEHLVGRVAVIDAGEFSGFELGKSCAVSGLLSTVHIGEGEILTTLEDDVLLEHAFTESLVLSLVDTLSH